MTIRRRLLLWYTSVLAISGGILMVSLYVMTAHQLRREADKFLADEFDGWAAVCRTRGDDVAGIEHDLAPEMEGRNYFPIFMRLYDEREGKDLLLIINGRPPSRLPAQPVCDAPVGEKVFSALLVAPRKEFRMITLRLDNRRILQGGIYIRRINDRLARLRTYVISAMAVSVGMGLAGGWLLTRRSLAPMDDIVADLERVQAASLAHRLVVPASQDEVAQLRRAINRMLDRLEDAFGKVSHFTADAAHELRTPLAALQCRLHVALDKARTDEEYRQVLADALAEASSLTRMVNDLLLLARMDAGADLPDKAEISLKALLDELHEPFAVAAEEKGLRLTFACQGECTILGDRNLLRRVFGNLLDNAIRYTPAGGSVSVNATHEGKECIVRIVDTGIGIPAEAQAKLGERFYRVDNARSRHAGGVGLGLNISRSIVTLHGGALSVTSGPGQGSAFEVRLPAWP